MTRLLSFAIAGLVAQLVDGALGMAYGVTATSVVLSTGVTAAAASASVHLAEVGTTLVSGLSHWRFGNVDWRLAVGVALPGAVGAFAGATVLSSVPAGTVAPYVSVILLVLGVSVLLRFARPSDRPPIAGHRPRRRLLGPLGLGAGFLDAVGGGGWGPLTTPTLLTAGRVEPRRAIGSVSASEFLVSLGASAGFLLSLGRQGVDVALAGALLAGGVVAAPLAAALVSRLPTAVLGTAVGGIVAVTNLRTLLLAAGAPGPARLVALLAVVTGVGLLVARVALGRRRAELVAESVA